MQLALLRLQDSIDYLQQSYRAYASGDKAGASEYLDLANAMSRRAHRHWLRATRGVNK